MIHRRWGANMDPGEMGCRSVRSESKIRWAEAAALDHIVFRRFQKLPVEHRGVIRECGRDDNPCENWIGLQTAPLIDILPALTGEGSTVGCRLHRVSGRYLGGVSAPRRDGECGVRPTTGGRPTRGRRAVRSAAVPWRRRDDSEAVRSAWPSWLKEYWIVIASERTPIPRPSCR